MAKQKFTVSFSVSQEVAERAKTIFPDGRTEEVLVRLLDLYENPRVPDNSENERYREIVDGLCNAYTVDLYDVTDFVNHTHTKLEDALQRTLDLDEENKDLKDENDRLGNENRILKGKTELLELDNQQINWDKIRTTLQPFTVALLEKTAEKLTTKYNRTISPMEILVDMFMRYTLERWNEWFYPFQLKDAEILALAKEINPVITSLSQLKKTLPQ